MRKIYVMLVSGWLGSISFNCVAADCNNLFLEKIYAELVQRTATELMAAISPVDIIQKYDGPRYKRADVDTQLIWAESQLKDLERQHLAGKGPGKLNMLGARAQVEMLRREAAQAGAAYNSEMDNKINPLILKVAREMDQQLTIEGFKASVAKEVATEVSDADSEQALVIPNFDADMTTLDALNGVIASVDEMLTLTNGVLARLPRAATGFFARFNPAPKLQAMAFKKIDAEARQALDADWRKVFVRAKESGARTEAPDLSGALDGFGQFEALGEALAQLRAEMLPRRDLLAEKADSLVREVIGIIRPKAMDMLIERIKAEMAAEQKSETAEGTSDEVGATNDTTSASAFESIQPTDSVAPPAQTPRKARKPRAKKPKEASDAPPKPRRSKTKVEPPPAES